MMIARSVILIASTVAFLLATPAEARTPSPEAEVRYADLDLGGEAGATTLLRRLDRAAERVCNASNTSFRDYRAARVARACKAQVMSKAVAKIDAPLVQSLYAAAQRGAIRVASAR